MADTKVSILGKDSIHCGFHLTPHIVKTVLTTLPSSTYVLISDTSVGALYLDRFEKEFDRALSALDSAKRPRFLAHLVPPGETSKSREGKADIEDYLLAKACTRDTVVLALGGGVIGDLVGFVAATFMRGVRFVQIPTTLLAMVDSSVGGKTAIDTPHGKNLIGAFWQPEYIFIDAAFLETLPMREFSNGMAEVVKTAAIWNEAEFASLESRSQEIFSAIQSRSDPNSTTRTPAQNLLLSVIVGSISVKAHIVTIDERETGLRNLVNFGHTIGHAIEAVLTPTILHGECVSIGMILEAEIARQLGVLSQVAVGRLTRCLKAYNLPVSVSDSRIARLPAASLLTVDRLLDIMRIDKKNSGPEKKIVLLSRVGATHEPKASVVKDNVISKTLSEAATVVSGTPAKNPVRMTTPGSKSISNRALLLAALSGGTCRLTNLLHSDDTQVMMTALIELKGASFEWEDGGETLVVNGNNGNLFVPSTGKEVYLGNAGTASRFLTTVCALAQPDSTSTHPATIITGNARMKQRPVGPLVDALRSNGAQVQYQESEGCLPLAIAPQGFKGGHIKLAASVSSQYVSSILLCAPCAQEDIVLELTGGQVISQLYIDMTIAMMRSFGATVTRRKDSSGKLLDVYDIPRSKYVAPATYAIESDASSATYPLAIAAITGTSCTITSIGSSSLQGDARFAKEVLEPMGCKVTQTETETTVQGPPVGQLKAIGLVNMEPMTDAFLTASVVAAVATGAVSPERTLKDGSRPTTTRILGIANQRVKECNRIKAMIDELAKFGVETKELEDGLEIYGKPLKELKQGVSVHCYDDHRVAMAFSVLGTVINGTVLEEKRCVEKTWPNWWDDLENKIGLHVEGVELSKSASSHVQPTSNKPASVIIIGMRGSGKTYIGGMAAAALGWRFIDADAYFEEKHSTLVSTFVKEKGWPAFREAETANLLELIRDYPTETVLSLGGGIVETEASREALKAYTKKGPVVRINRDIKEILAYLADETSRPAYGETVEDVYRRRAPWYAECSSHDFVSYSGPLPTGKSVAPSRANGLASVLPPLPRDFKPSASIRPEVERYFRHVTGVEPNLAANLRKGKRSYFLSLTFPDLIATLASDNEPAAGVDAVEVRADLLTDSGIPAKPGNVPSLAYVADQLAALRHRTSLPIVFTVRTVSQGGAFPDEAEKEALALCKLALRHGCEYLDVEVSWAPEGIRSIISNKGNSKIIASWHDWSGKMAWDGPAVKAKYQLADSFGDIVKIVGKANTLEDNLTLSHFVQQMNAKPNAKPFLAINMGLEGQLSRILNPTFSPVTHPLLPVKAAPGQLSFSEIQTALHLMGQLPAKQFYLLGTPIAQSMSPTIHNTGYKMIGLPHRYSLFETQTVGEEVKKLVASPDFGGASVTIPHKLAIIPLMDELTEEVKLIGAVNTIIPVAKADSTRKLVGANTDWQGIRASVLKHWPTSINSTMTGLVIGAGGTSRAALYALHNLGVGTIYVFNRTKSKAEELVAAFPKEYNAVVVERLDQFPGAPPTIVVGTVPATTTSIDRSDPTKMTMLPGIFAADKGVVVDMAYRPAITPLLQLAAHRTGWVGVPGLEVLLEQGFKQFELWTGRRPPYHAISRRVWAAYEL